MDSHWGGPPFEAFAIFCHRLIAALGSKPAHPVIASIKARMLGAGAYYAMMSGSGPTVFAFTDTKETAAKVQAALDDYAVETAITTTIGRMK